VEAQQAWHVKRITNNNYSYSYFYCTVARKTKAPLTPQLRSSWSRRLCLVRCQPSRTQAQQRARRQPHEDPPTPRVKQWLASQDCKRDSLPANLSEDRGCGRTGRIFENLAGAQLPGIAAGSCDAEKPAAWATTFATGVGAGLEVNFLRLRCESSVLDAAWMGSEVSSTSVQMATAGSPSKDSAPVHESVAAESATLTVAVPCATGTSASLQKLPRLLPCWEAETAPTGT